jgi:hypothetical protein
VENSPWAKGLRIIAELLRSLVVRVAAWVLFAGLMYLAFAWITGDIAWGPTLFAAGSGSSTKARFPERVEPFEESDLPETHQPLGIWECRWDPSMNQNWHDDVLCTRGTESIRPVLLPNDRYVTQEEIMRAAQEYEDQLNR